MQLVQHDSRTEDASETEPILPQPSTTERSEESSSSVEINVGVDPFVASGDSPVLEIDEDICLVRADQPQCRICLDTEGEDLIAPCQCKGTQKYVHRSCLDNWRSTKGKVYIASECPSRSLVVEDKVSVSCCEGSCGHFRYCSTGVLVYKFYGDELREMFGYEEHPYGFYTMAVLAIVLVGLLYGFFIAIICGQRINERHYHVLAKQELTKEYVVEDRETHKDVSELDPSHVTELRMLGLY